MAAAPTPPAADAQSAAPRIIPGFKVQPVQETKKTRSRPKKKAAGNGTATDAATAVVSDGVATTETAPEAADLSAPLVVSEADDDEGVVGEKKTAVEAVAKRIRAANKKLQRIVSYEENTEILNQDQQKAIASKPVYEAVVKELQELLAILKTEEVEEERRLAAIKVRAEKRHARELEAAIASAKKASQSDFAFHCQFLHLYGLIARSDQGFAPPSLPAVLATADGNDIAGVRCLYDGFTNGPLLGGHGDVLEKLAKLVSGADEPIAPTSTTFARVKELVEGLTAAPSPIAAEPVTASTLPANPSDSVTALVDGSAEQQAAPSFLQESELVEEAPSAEEKVSSWADEVAEQEPPAPAPATTNGGLSATEKGVMGWGAPVAPSVPAVQEPAPVAAATQPLDWSEDHNDLPALPSLEGITPQATQVPAPAPAPAPVVPTTTGPIVDEDGFTQAGRAPRRGNAPGGPRSGRGGFEGGRGRGGGFRGRGPREGGAPSDGQWTRQPRGDRPPGEFRGGRGGGRGRGEGRGRGRGGASPSAASPAPATPTA
ncbi:hypothetical protein T439DRAFT_323658 [Meredithblackwellia eburnea MCA 4105]